MTTCECCGRAPSLRHRAMSWLDDAATAAVASAVLVALTFTAVVFTFDREGAAASPQVRQSDAPALAVPATPTVGPVESQVFDVRPDLLVVVLSDGRIVPLAVPSKGA